MQRSVGVAIVSLLGVLAGGVALTHRGSSPLGAIPPYGNQPPSAPAIQPPALAVPAREAEASSGPTVPEAAADRAQGAASAQDLAALREAVTALQAQVTALQHSRRQQDRVTRSRAEDPPAAPRPDRAARAEADRLRQQQMATVEAAFHQEPVDPPWATTATAAVQAALARDEVLQNLLLGLECRAQQCRVELAQDETGELAKPLALLLHHLGATFPTTTVSTSDDGTGGPTMVLYLSREAPAPPLARQ